MFALKHVLLVTLLIAASFSKIGIRDGLPDLQLLKDDVVDFDLKSVFDFSKVNGKVTYASNIGHAFNIGEPFAYKNLDFYQVTQANNVRAHENWVTAIYDDTTVVFQIVDTDGKRFLGTEVVDLKKFGAGLTCTGTAYNRKRQLMYIGCFDKTSTPSSPGAIFIFTWDFNQAKIVSEVSVKQDDGFRIVNELVLFIEEFPQEGGKNADDVYLLAYDQGHTLQTETRMSNNARIFFNVSSGDLEFDTLAQVTMDGQEFDIIYDMFPYQNTIIISGRIKGIGSIITLSQCKLDLNTKTIPCGPNPKPTLIVSGAVKIDQRSMAYHEMDISSKTLRYYKLQGQFADKNWNTNLIHTMTNINMPKMDEANIWIKGLHTSHPWGGVIYYGSPSHVDPGVTYIDWHSGTTLYDSQKVGTIYDRTFVLAGVHGSSKSLMLVRDEQLYLIEGGYYSGNNKIMLTASDADGGVTATSNLVILDHIWDKVKIKNTIGNIELQANQDLVYAFREQDILDGNGLNVKVTTSNKILSAEGFNSAPVRVSWAGSTQTGGTYAFAHDKVVLVNGFGSIVWGTCVDKSNKPITIVCTEQGSQALGAGSNLNSKIIAQQGLTLAFSNNVNKNSSTVWILGDDGKFGSQDFTGIISDIGFMATSTYYYAFMVFDKQRVEIWQLNKNDLKEFTQYKVIDNTQIDDDNFCPHAVSIPPQSTDEYDILSDCGRVGKAILRMGLSHNTNHFDIPLSMRYHTVGFCSFKNEYVINTYEEVFSIGNNDTFDFWTVPMDDLDGGFSYDMFCVPNLNKVAYVAHGSKGNKNTLVSQNAVTGGVNQGRRFPGFTTNVEATGVKAYEFLDRLVWVIENNQSTTFLTTFDTPMIKFTAGSTQDEVDVQVSITISNKGSKQTFLQLATIYPHA